MTENCILLLEKWNSPFSWKSFCYIIFAVTRNKAIFVWTFVFYWHHYRKLTTLTQITFVLQVIGETLPYDNIQEIRARLNQVAPNLTRYGLVEEANFFAQAAELAATQKKLALSKDPIDVTQKILTDFYMTDAITRASPTMAKCVQAVKAHLESGYKKV